MSELLQSVIQNSWGSIGETNVSESTNTVSSAVKLETAFRKASELMPHRLDLRFDIASALIAQALQTNGPQLELKVKDALHEYGVLQSMDTNGFACRMLAAAYARAIGETNVCQAMLEQLTKLDPARTGQYLQRFKALDRILQTSPTEKIQRLLPRNTRQAIVLLGAGLETNGLAKPKLIARLEQCRRLARMYPHAQIILTGGNQKAGVTEAYVMSQWCRHRGISQKRLILEDRARDTVENALFSATILQKLHVTHVTLVSSSSHLRRGLADLQEACQQRGLLLDFAAFGTKKADGGLDSEQERLGVYRDVMRLSGFWAFPGLER